MPLCIVGEIIIAGSNASVSGNIEVDGKEIDPVACRRHVAYVMQDDALLPTATPRECLAFSAALRRGVFGAEREELVDRMLEELNIKGCADVMVGGAMIKGISGGQRKRTSPLVGAKARGPGGV